MTLKYKLTALAGVVGMLAASSALAANATVTWDPSGTLPPLAATGAFTADKVFLADYSSITIASNNAGPNNFTEQGFLPVTAFGIGGATVGTPVNQAGGYGLYIAFTGSGVQNGPLPTTLGESVSGSFSSLSYTLFGVPGHPATFNLNGDGTFSVSNNAGAIALATGSLINPGGTSLTLTAAGYLPAAQVVANFIPNQDGQAAGFFVNPNATVTLQLDAAFTNTSSVITTQSLGGGATRISINGGGGNATFAVAPIPEPETYAMMLAGLGLMGFVARRRMKK